MKPLDMAVIALYLIGTTLLGLYFAKRQKTTRDYFLGNKNLPWWAILLSIIAQETSAVTILSIPATAFNPKGGNLTFLQVAAGYVIGRCLISIIFIPRLYKGEYFSIYGYLTERFGAATKNVAVLSFIVSRSLAIGARIFVGSILISAVSGFDTTQSIIITTLLSILYMTMGGFAAVVWTDVLQFVIYMLSALTTMAVILYHPIGGSNIIHTAMDAGKYQLFNFTTDLTVPYALWAGLIGGAFLTMCTHGTDQGIAQRLLAANSERNAKKIIIGSGLVIFFQFAFFLTLGTLLFGFYSLVEPTIFTTIPKNDYIFPIFALKYLPLGLGGLMVAGVFAAAMSSNDFNPMSNALINDIYKPYIKPHAQDTHYLYMGKVFTVVFGLITLGVAILASKSQKSLLDLVMTIPSYTFGPLLGIFLMGFFSKKSHQLGVITGAVAGFLVLLTVVPPWPAAWELYPGLYPKLAWPWLSMVGCLTTMIVGQITSLLFPRKV